MQQMNLSISFISDGKYQIDEILFDQRKKTLTYREKEKYCSKQIFNLLSAFIYSDDCFLSNKEIVNICGWPLDDMGFNEKRRTVIKYLRKQLYVNETNIRIEFIPVREGYHLYIVG